MFILEEKHLNEAKKIAEANRKKKSCNNCYDRGYVGYTPENLLVLCHKCVDTEKALEDWKNYVSQFPELKEHFEDLFKENEEETQTEN